MYRCCYPLILHSTSFIFISIYCFATLLGSIKLFCKSEDDVAGVFLVLLRYLELLDFFSPRLQSSSESSILLSQRFQLAHFRFNNLDWNLLHSYILSIHHFTSRKKFLSIFLLHLHIYVKLNRGYDLFNYNLLLLCFRIIQFTIKPKISKTRIHIAHQSCK